MALFYISTAILIFVGHQRPLISKLRNKTEIFNEVLIIIIMYHFFVFTDFVLDARVKYTVGYSCCGFLLLNIVGNLTLLTRDSILKALKHQRATRKRKMEKMLTQRAPAQRAPAQLIPAKLKSKDPKPNEVAPLE